jgi:hypothetical protein
MRNSIWVNIKKGTYYAVLNEVINCTNEQDGQTMILYRSLDDSELPLFVREKSEFLTKFKIHEG